jgi:hypothetical protein
MRRPLAAIAAAVAILAAATAGGLLIAACGGSSDSASATQTATAEGSGGQPLDMSSMFAQALDPLVTDGTITSDQESAVIDALSSSGPGGAQGQGGQPSPGATPPSGEMPSDGATPPSGGQQGSMPDPSQMFDSTLDGLVDDGTITASQQTAISEALSSAMQQAGPGQQSSTSAVGSVQQG